MIDLKHHSASKASTFRNDPSWFIASYMLGYRGETSGKMAAGKAVEAGLWQHMLHGDAEASTAAALAEFDGEMAGEVTKERDDITPMLEKAVSAVAEFGKPLTYQTPVKLAAQERYGFAWPVVGYIDFGFDGFDLDLKCTWQLPSKPRFDHIAQVGLYSQLRDGKPQKIAYVTPKKFAVYDISPEDLDMGWRVTAATFRRIENLCSICDTAQDAIKIIPLNTESFYWPENLKQQAMGAWNV
jgi:hypothetical protein